MNTESMNPSDDIGQKSQDAPQCTCPAKKCRFFLILLIGLVVLGGGAVYWAFFVRIHNLPVYRSSMRQIEASRELQEWLGQPIRAVHWPPPSARIETSETEVRWNIAGPKAPAKAHVLARLMMGEWQTTVLEVTLVDGKKIALRDEANTDAEAPRFERAKPERNAPEANAPAPEINLPTPPVDMPGQP